MKYLGIDYGQKKIGLALSDEGLTLAFPKEIIKNNAQCIESIAKVIKLENISKIIIGDSFDLEGNPNKIMSEIKIFAKNLEKFNLPIHFEKEFLTSVESRRYQDVHQSDSGAAALILQRFLDRENIKNKV